MRLIWKAIRLVSVGFLLLNIFGYLAARNLPTNGYRYGSRCYWTDAMFAFVECGEKAALGSLREGIYNLYFFVLLLPPIALKFRIELLPLAIAAWGAIIIAVVVILRFFYSLLRWPK